MTKATKSGLTPGQADWLRKRLLDERAILAGRLAARRAALGGSTSREPDEGDWAASSAHQSLLARLTDRDSKLVREVDRALAKLAEGGYGICELSGEPIGFDRLWARPWARHAVASKEQVERTKVQVAASDLLGSGEGSPDHDGHDEAA